MPNDKNVRRHTISVWVDNQPGVLSRVTGLFSGRGFNIESLCVAETMDPETSRITFVSSGDEQIIEQIIKQLRKLINTVKVVDLSELEHVEREMALVRVKAEDKSRAEVLRIADIFRCRVVDVSPNTYTLEITGTHEKLGGAGPAQDARHPGRGALRRPGHPAGQEGLAISHLRCQAISQGERKNGSPACSPQTHPSQPPFNEGEGWGRKVPHGGRGCSAPAPSPKSY
jgi:acetolactate synthase I/III small subunit